MPKGRQDPIHRVPESIGAKVASMNEIARLSRFSCSELADRTNERGSRNVTTLRDEHDSIWGPRRGCSPASTTAGAFGRNDTRSHDATSRDAAQRKLEIIARRHRPAQYQKSAAQLRCDGCGFTLLASVLGYEERNQVSRTSAMGWRLAGEEWNGCPCFA